MKKIFIAIGKFFKWIWLNILSFFRWLFRIKPKSEEKAAIQTGGKKRSFEYGLHRTKKSFGERILNVLKIKKDIDELIDELEEVLVTGDVGVETALEILERFKDESIKRELKDETPLKELFKEIVTDVILDKRLELHENKLNVIFVFGVNGVGKTTSIGKLSMLFKSQGKKVLIAACDTFRAAASKQLAKWAYSVDVQIVKHHEGGDPAAVLYDAIDAALSRKMDILIVDTAGRFHNRQNLMQELAKLNKVIDKKAGNCNRQNLLVLDANTGHNAFVQASEFSQSVPIHGIIMAKLDSTAKGGIILPISNKLKIPVYFAGIGEKAEDLIEFDRKSFINSVF